MNSESDKMLSELPADYEPCGTCDYDHVYDYGISPMVSRIITASHSVPDEE